MPIKQFPAVCKLREGVKKRTFDRKRLPHPTYGQLFMIFFVFLILDYDYMSSETDFTQEKGHFHQISYIDLQQVYLLQSEAQKDKTLTFICEYFRHHGRIKHWKCQRGRGEGGHVQSKNS